jgi:hypothetical protein
MFPSRYFPTRYFPTRYYMSSGAAPPASIGTFYFKRNTNIYISKDPNTSADATNTVSLKVKDFSFNQRSNMVNVERQTLDPTSERTIAPHISAVAPVTFSFITYILPLVDTNVTSPEEYLWVSLMGADSLTSNSTSSTIDFADGNVGSLPELTLWFNDPDKGEGNYRLDNAIVDSARINFDINGIAEIQWSGRALTITTDYTPPLYTDSSTADNYLKNKLSTITLSANSISYTLALTGGSIDINNNNIFYGRTQMGRTTIPVGHYTGNRRISGDLNFYLKAGTNTSVDLFDGIRTNAVIDDYETIWDADITINIAGITAPNIQLNIPSAILGIPQENFGEVITLALPFTAKEGTGNYSTIIYNMP